MVRTPGTGATELFVSEDSRDAAALEPVPIQGEVVEAVEALKAEAEAEAEPAAEVDEAAAEAAAEAAKLAEEEEIARNLP